MNIESSLTDARMCIEALLADKEALDRIEEACILMCACLSEGGKIMSCGNGGSLTQSMHFAEELTGRFRKDRPALGAVSFSDPSHMSCTANDYGFRYVFSRMVEGIGRAGDVLLALSTSGASGNVLEAVRSAKKTGVKTVCLTGVSNSALGLLSDIDICTQAKGSDRIQELHGKVLHVMVEMIERSLFAGLYFSSEAS